MLAGAQPQTVGKNQFYVNVVRGSADYSNFVF
jgi:hypothetical protein